MKTTVIYHRADFDGIFCREIAKKFIPDAELIGWDFGDPTVAFPKEGSVYILDLPIDRVFGFNVADLHDVFLFKEQKSRIIWIDHHASSIASHPSDINGYRIDGVAACRLAWQWFQIQTGAHDNGIDTATHRGFTLPEKQDYIGCDTAEPWAVRLAGEYDIWCKRDPDAELFQHGLKSEELYSTAWDDMLDESQAGSKTVVRLLNQGRAVQYAKTQENASVIMDMGFTFKWEGLTFLCCNAARYNSLLFTAGLKPEHDACLGFKWTGKNWSVSLYHAPGREHHDLSKIAVKHGGGGHRGACGFVTTEKLPFLP